MAVLDVFRPDSNGHQNTSIQAFTHSLFHIPPVRCASPRKRLKAFQVRDSSSRLRAGILDTLTWPVQEQGGRTLALSSLVWTLPGTAAGYLRGCG